MLALCMQRQAERLLCAPLRHRYPRSTPSEAGVQSVFSSGMGLGGLVDGLRARGGAISQAHPDLAGDATAASDRKQELIRCYRSHERPELKGIGVSELRGLASTHHSPAANLQQATEALQELDLDGDGKVSQAEWLAGMTAATEHVSQATFADVSRALWHCSLETCDTAPGTAPAEPLNSVEYVRRTLARHLHGGLAALCARIAEEHTAVASQRLWDADGHLSEGYRPFNATRWLGEWLQAHNEYKEAVVDDPRTLDWTAGVPWAQLSLDRQLQLAFHHLDEHESGYVGSPQAQVMVASFLPDDAPEGAAALLERMDMMGAHDLDVEEVMEYAHSALAQLAPDEQLRALRPFVCAYYLGTHGAEDQCRIVFEHLMCRAAERAAAVGNDDADSCEDDASTAGSSSAAADEVPGGSTSGATQCAAAAEAATIGLALVAALARHVLDVHAPVKLQAALAGVPRSAAPAEAVDAAGFAAAVRQICPATCASPRRLADVLAPVLADRLELDATAELAPAYAEHVRRQPLHAWVPPIAPGAVAALSERPDVCEVLLLDCRTDEEYELSSVADATPCDMLEDPSSEHGWQVDQDCLDEVAEAIQEAIDMPTAGAPAVVTLCTDGARGALVAMRLYERFPDVRVFNVCGGLIAWRNAGLPLEDAFGREVEELHPHHDDLARFFEAPL